MQKYSRKSLKLEIVDREATETTRDEGISCVGKPVVDRSLVTFLLGKRTLLNTSSSHLHWGIIDEDDFNESWGF